MHNNEVKEGDSKKIEGVNFSKFFLFSLSLIDFCNLDCTYCYAKSNGKGTYLPYEKIKTFLEFFSEYAPPKTYFTLSGGGEPTLHPQILDIIDSITENFIDSTIFISTNGVIPKKLLKKLLERDIILKVSFSGLPEIQDNERPLRNSKKKSSEIVLKTMKRIIEVAPNKLNWAFDYSKSKFGREKEIVNFMASLGVKKMLLNIIEPAGRKSLEYFTGNKTFPSSIKEHTKVV